jgi:hypothetical protein
LRGRDSAHGRDDRLELVDALDLPDDIREAIVGMACLTVVKEIVQDKLGQSVCFGSP